MEDTGRFEDASSYHYSDFEILTKIIAEDATMQACLKVITSTCLSHGIEVECQSGKVTADFVKFVQRHYVPFCEEAIRCMFLCGFVPWRTRVIHSGAVVPETMPIGAFTWVTEPTQCKRKHVKNNSSMEFVEPPRKRRNIGQSNEALVYNIRFLRGIGISENDVYIYQYVKPMAQRRGGALQSPLSGIVDEYRHIYRALARAEYADEWNTQAKLICSYTSVNNLYNMNEGNPITNDWSVPQNRSGVVSDSDIPTELEQNVYVRDAVMERVVSSKSASHAPMIYSMPKNSKLENVAPLHSDINIDILQASTARNIACILGVPFEIIGGGYSEKQGGKKSLENSRVFVTNMTSICTHLQNLLLDVYTASFPGSKMPLSFRLQASPRLEVTNIQELLLLFESGLLTVDNAFQMTHMILGLDIKHAGGTHDTKFDKSKQFVPLAMAKNTEKK
jgi:hypothetical protein